MVVGKELRDRHNSPKSRLRLEIVGEPNWPDYDDQSRLELWYDETDCTFRASQPVTVSDDARDTPLASEKAALDIGANNLVACTTTTGEQYLYEGRELFQRFRDTTREIARLQSKLREGRYSSERIRRLYRKRTRRRDHAQEALCRDLLERLYAEGVDTVYIGGLTDVLETHWSVETNAKTHNFWAFKQFTERLACTAEEYSISVEVRSEAWTSQECPQCGSTDRTTRHQDTLTCPCGFEGHADLTAFARRDASCVPTRTFGSRDVRNVPEAAYEQRSQADGTARAVRVGRPQLVGDTTPSRKSQRTAHRPEYRPPQRECCLRGITDRLRLQRRKPRRSRRGGCHRTTVAVGGEVETNTFARRYSSMAKVSKNRRRSLWKPSLSRGRSGPPRTRSGTRSTTSSRSCERRGSTRSRSTATDWRSRRHWGCCGSR
ncbi:Transposable element [Halapricum desulfuricans]|uniref:Transposable element n=1 Tax=Halapricum desulfuricans TaxID=2841257 RepID=A0A897NLB8_9EURY|nr:Transposable element [Halapricum desulfuricans]